VAHPRRHQAAARNPGPPRLRRLAPLLVILAAACGGSEPVTSGACVAALEFNGDPYVLDSSAPALQPGSELAAVSPACNDTNTEPPGEDRPVTAHRIEGIDPVFAIMGSRGDVYVNAATFTALPSHPLHSPGRAPRVSGRPCRVSGQATVRTSGLFVGEVAVYVRPDTRVTIPRAYIPTGTPITVTGRCRSDGNVWATRITG
jgi:hypothetical protein